MATASQLTRLLRSVRVVVPLYKEAGEDFMEFFNHVERKLNHEFGTILSATGIKCVNGIPIEPMASGVMAVYIGRHNDKFDWLKYSERWYDVTVKLGEARVPACATGELLDTKPFEHVTETAVLQQLKVYRGPLQQRRPTVLQHLTERPAHLLPIPERVHETPRVVICYAIKLKRFEPPLLDLDVHCGANFHLRTFTEDFGTALGTVAHMTKIHRRKHGPFTVEDSIPSYAVSWKRFEEANKLHKLNVQEYATKIKTELHDVWSLLKPSSIYR